MDGGPQRAKMWLVCVSAYIVADTGMVPLDMTRFSQAKDIGNCRKYE